MEKFTVEKSFLRIKQISKPDSALWDVFRKFGERNEINFQVKSLLRVVVVVTQMVIKPSISFGSLTL